jgi:hypothetical protein
MTKERPSVQKNKLERLLRKMHDIIVTDIRYLVPCAFRWFYRRMIERDISLRTLQNSSGRKAMLYRHGSRKLPEGKARAALILHARYSHPLLMLHLADITHEQGLGPVFSLAIDYDDSGKASHRSLLKEAIDQIQATMREEGAVFDGIVIVGHSRGAIEGAYRAFVELDMRIISIISIAGRLRLVDINTHPCLDYIKKLVRRIDEGIRARPEFPLYQIAGQLDWNATTDSMIVRRDEAYFHIIDDAMHFNILFHKDLSGKYLEFLKRSFDL